MKLILNRFANAVKIDDKSDEEFKSLAAFNELIVDKYNVNNKYIVNNGLSDYLKNSKTISVKDNIHKTTYFFELTKRNGRELEYELISQLI